MSEMRTDEHSTADRHLVLMPHTHRSAFPHVTAWVDPTLQHKNRAEILVEGPEIVVRPVAARHC
jgi:hypothetical protein